MSAGSKNNAFTQLQIGYLSYSFYEPGAGLSFVAVKIVQTWPRLQGSGEVRVEEGIKVQPYQWTVRVALQRKVLGVMKEDEDAV